MLETECSITTPISADVSPDIVFCPAVHFCTSLHLLEATVIIEANREYGSKGGFLAIPFFPLNFLV